MMKIGSVLAALLLAASCSVKEERDGCPVYVTVVTDRFIQNGHSDGIVSFHALEAIDRESISFLSYIGTGFRQACPRDYARAAVLSGLEHEKIDATTLYVPFGRQAGRVWSYGETFSAQEDEYRIEAVPHKQYCLVKFFFGDSPTAPADYPWRFRIRAACNAMNIYTAEPLAGEYCCPVGPDAAGEWYAVIPRQQRNDLQLELFVPEAGSLYAGETEYEVDLGKRFEEKGYDWTQPDLTDIAVKVGFASTGIQVEVLDWNGDDSYRSIEI